MGMGKNPWVWLCTDLTLMALVIEKVLGHFPISYTRTLKSIKVVMFLQSDLIVSVPSLKTLSDECILYIDKNLEFSFVSNMKG